MKTTTARVPKLDGKPYRIAIIASRYNETLMEKLLKNTIQTLGEHHVLESNIEVYRVPGALELPVMALKLSRRPVRRNSKTFDVLIALGIIIKGETAHFEYVSEHSYRGLMEVSLRSGIPVIFGILTTYTLQQAIDRTSEKGQNKGREYAETAIEMAQKLR